ncbi:unnamed protein product, partial [marine sediment metagenome]
GVGGAKAKGVGIYPVTGSLAPGLVSVPGVDMNEGALFTLNSCYRFIFFHVSLIVNHTFDLLSIQQVF